MLGDASDRGLAQNQNRLLYALRLGDGDKQYDRGKWWSCFGGSVLLLEAGQRYVIWVGYTAGEKVSKGWTPLDFLCGAGRVYYVDYHLDESRWSPQVEDITMSLMGKAILMRVDQCKKK